MSHKTDQKAYWDGVAEEKTFTLPLYLPLIEDEARRLFPEDPRRVRLLDYGCGYGRILGELAAAGYAALYGLDFSAAMLERARRELAPCPVPPVLEEPGKDGGVPHEDGFFDGIILMALLTCITADGELEKLLAELFRVLKPGGFLYVSDFLLNDDERNRRRYEAFAEKTGVYGAFILPEGAAVRHFREDHIRALLRRCGGGSGPAGSGLEEIHFSKETHTTMNGHRSRGFTWLGRKPERP
jgi:SAM-dependent methyltransferase